MNEPQGDVVSTKEDIVASQTVESKRTYCRVCMVMCGLVADEGHAIDRTPTPHEWARP